MALVTPVMESTREYSCAVNSSRSSGADVRPTDSTTSNISRGFMPFMRANSNESTAPTPAPSVGVKKPSQIPPSVRNTTMITVIVLQAA